MDDLCEFGRETVFLLDGGLEGARHERDRHLAQVEAIKEGFAREGVVKDETKNPNVVKVAFGETICLSFSLLKVGDRRSGLSEEEEKDLLWDSHRSDSEPGRLFFWLLGLRILWHKSV